MPRMRIHGYHRVADGTVVRPRVECIALPVLRVERAVGCDPIWMLRLLRTSLLIDPLSAIARRVLRCRHRGVIEMSEIVRQVPSLN